MTRGYTLWWEYRAQWWREKGCLFSVLTLSYASLLPVPLGLQHRQCEVFPWMHTEMRQTWLGSPRPPSVSSLLAWTCASWSSVGLSLLHPSAGVSSCFSFSLALLAQSLSLKTRSHLGFEHVGLIKFTALSNSRMLW